MREGGREGERTENELSILFSEEAFPVWKEVSSAEDLDFQMKSTGLWPGPVSAPGSRGGLLWWWS